MLGSMWSEREEEKMLSIVEPLVMCFSCSFCVVVRIETDGKRKAVGRCHVAVGVKQW